jgi:hypothetical protein
MPITQPERSGIRDIMTRYQSMLMSKPNVIGTGIGYRESGGQVTDEPALMVLVRQKVPRETLTTQDLVPDALDGRPTDVIQVGDLQAQIDRQERQRPAPAGISIGHYQITAGTFGAVVRDRVTGERLMLSNNHVLAASNLASIGDPILQPGAADSGTVQDDIIGQLLRFCPIDFGDEPAGCSIFNLIARIVNSLAAVFGANKALIPIGGGGTGRNLVDCAVAKPANDADILDEIMQIGAVTAVKEAELGMSVRKFGRTTGFTTGFVRVMDATVTVGFGTDRAATFDEQILLSNMSLGGDSGSLIVDNDSPSAIGLLFAGSDEATIANPIQAVFDCLNVQF